MDLTTLKEAANVYEALLQRELSAKAELALLETEIQNIAYAQEKINGKNAELRKLQLAVALNEDGVYLSTQRDARNFEVQRKGQEAYIGLLKAWLYSQSGVV